MRAEQNEREMGQSTRQFKLQKRSFATTNLTKGTKKDTTGNGEKDIIRFPRGKKWRETVIIAKPYESEGENRKARLS